MACIVCLASWRVCEVRVARVQNLTTGMIVASDFPMDELGAFFQKLQ